MRNMCVIGRQSYVWCTGEEEAHPPLRRAPLRLCVCIHEISQPLDLHEIKPATLVRAARKLTRSGEATRWDAPERG
jgi:hypothetical protein